MFVPDPLVFDERKHAELLEMVVADFLGSAKFGCGSVGDRVVACSRRGCLDRVVADESRLKVVQKYEKDVLPKR